MNRHTPQKAKPADKAKIGAKPAVGQVPHNPCVVADDGLAVDILNCGAANLEALNPEASDTGSSQRAVLLETANRFALDNVQAEIPRMINAGS